MGPRSTGPTYPVWIQHLTKPAYVDVVAIIVKKPNENSNKKASIRLSVLNRHPEAAWEGVLKFDHFGESTQGRVVWTEGMEGRIQRLMVWMGEWGMWSVVDVEGVEVHSMYHDDMSAVVSRFLRYVAFRLEQTTDRATLRSLLYVEHV